MSEELTAATQTLADALTTWRQLQTEVVAKLQSGGSTDEVDEQRARDAQIQMAVALDSSQGVINSLAPKTEADAASEEWQIAMGAFAETMQQFSALVFSVHSGRAQILGETERVCERVIREAFQLQDRAVASAANKT